MVLVSLDPIRQRAGLVKYGWWVSTTQFSSLSRALVNPLILNIKLERPTTSFFDYELGVDKWN